MLKYPGVFCVISAPSGTGKSTLVQTILKCNHFIIPVQLSISYTTRKKRNGEIHGKDYYFISFKEFKYMIHQNMFFEYAKVFNDFYGTKKYEIEDMLCTEKNIILNIDWQGAKSIRKKVSNIYTIFILPPSKKELMRRLSTRGKDSEKTISIRIKNIINDICHINEYDYIIINDDLKIASRHLQSIILSEQLRYIHQRKKYKNLIDNLLCIN